MRRALLLCLFVAHVIACAEVRPPPGGPVDKTPPVMVEAAPGSLATGVEARAPLRFRFSEKLDRAAFARALTTIPEVELERPRFDDLTVEIRPRADWPDSVAIVWLLDPTLRDKHGVPMGTPRGGAFTRADSLPPGRFVGVARVEEPKADASIVATLNVPDPEGGRRGTLWRRSTATEEGHFALEHLRPGSGPYDLLVFEDGNRDGRRDEREPVASRDSLFLPDSLRTLDLGVLELIDLEGPVQIWVCLAPPADSVSVLVYAEPLAEGQPTTASVDSTGCAGPLSVVPGATRFGAWVDVDGDRRHGLDSLGLAEAYLDPIEVEVLPATPDTLTLGGPWLAPSQAVFDTLGTRPIPPSLQNEAPR